MARDWMKFYFVAPEPERFVAEVERLSSMGLLRDPEFLHAPYVDMNRSILELAEAGEFAKASSALNDYLVHSERIVLAVYARQLGDGRLGAGA